MLDRYRPFNRLVGPRGRWTICLVRLILIAAFTWLVWPAAGCGSDKPATRPTPAATATITSPPARVADVRFVPTVSSVGEVLKVQGFNWQRGPITVYLVPESQRANVESGSNAELYVLGESRAKENQPNAAGERKPRQIIGVEAATKLGGDHDFFASALDPLADQSLAAAVAVDVGGIEKGHPKVEGTP